MKKYQKYFSEKIIRSIIGTSLNLLLLISIILAIITITVVLLIISKSNSLAVFKDIKLSYIKQATWLIFLLSLAFYSSMFCGIQMSKSISSNNHLVQFFYIGYQSILKWYPIFAITLFFLLAFPENAFNLFATILSIAALLKEYLKRASYTIFEHLEQPDKIISLIKRSKSNKANDKYKDTKQ